MAIILKRSAQNRFCCRHRRNVKILFSNGKNCSILKSSARVFIFFKRYLISLFFFSKRLNRFIYLYKKTKIGRKTCGHLRISTRKLWPLFVYFNADVNSYFFFFFYKPCVPNDFSKMLRKSENNKKNKKPPICRQ